MSIEKINSLCEIADDYDAVLCDVWGVLHNGVSLFAGSAPALQRFREKGGKVILLSNMPRPTGGLKARLDELGFPPDAYDDILTSGDLARQILQQRIGAGQKCFFIGPERHSDLTAGCEGGFADIEAADFIMISGPRDDAVETPADYHQDIENWRSCDVPLICANPDHTVQQGDKIIYCAGAIAALYQDVGGEVMWLGKPYLPVYEEAHHRARALCQTQNPRLLMIGDGVKTDLPGAALAGIDALFILGGLASADVTINADDPDNIAAHLKAHQTKARAYMNYLSW